MNWKHLSNCKVIRLNATLFPVSKFETKLYQKYCFNPLQIEANTPDEIIPHVSDCDAIFAIAVSLPKVVIENLSRCRVISRLGTGTDKIDVETATQKGILVTNVPYFCVEEQADHTMAFLLALARKLPQMSQAMQEGAWSRSKVQAGSNQRLSNCVLGLIAFGNSAQAVAQRARGFGLKVLATRRNMSASKHEANCLGVEMVSLDDVLSESDYLSLHLPLTSQTYHLIDQNAFNKMKPGAYLINTSRGALVDENALVEVLENGYLAGAGLDTFERINPFSETETPLDDPLLSFDNVVLTPHVAAHSIQAAQDVAEGGIQNVVSILSNHWPKPENVVNPEVKPIFPLTDYGAAMFLD